MIVEGLCVVVVWWCVACGFCCVPCVGMWKRTKKGDLGC